MGGNITEVLTPTQGALFTLACVLVPVLAMVVCELVQRRADRKRAQEFAAVCEYLTQRSRTAQRMGGFDNV